MWSLCDQFRSQAIYSIKLNYYHVWLHFGNEQELKTWTILTKFIFAFLDGINKYIFMLEYIHIFHRQSPSLAILCDHWAISFDHGRSIVKIELSCLITFRKWTWKLLTIFIFAFHEVIACCGRLFVNGFTARSFPSARKQIIALSYN